MVELIPVEQVARELKTTNRKVIVAIKNGTLPIGAVAEPQNETEHYTAKIFKKRWEMYKEGLL